MMTSYTEPLTPLQRSTGQPHLDSDEDEKRENHGRGWCHGFSLPTAQQSVSSNRVRIQEQMVSISKGPNWSTECNSHALFQALCDLELKNPSAVFYPIIFHTLLKPDCLCHSCFYLHWSSIKRAFLSSLPILNWPIFAGQDEKWCPPLITVFSVLYAWNKHNTVNQPYSFKN